jgi:ubiquinone/menaquinone biosynthesis C-methylase UbiE
MKASPRTDVPAGINSTFWNLLVSETLADATVLDIGTGSGRVALAVAPLCQRVVGVDRETEPIEEARRRAAAAGIRNAEFVVADADSVDYGALVPEAPRVVTAHQFLSDPLVEKSARVLLPGGALVMVGFHVDQWKETGRASRFAYDEERMRRLLESNGFVVEHLSVEREVQTFGSVEEALAAAIALQEKWKSDGRWFRYIKFLEDGGRTLTRSQLIVKARRGRRP